MPKASIYVVEHQASVAMEIKDCLEQLGYRVCGTGSSGVQALQAVPDLRPDLVLMDVMLGGNLEGIRTAEALRKHIDVPIVYLSEISDEDVLDRSKTSGPYGYLLKPFGQGELRVVIEVALSKHEADRKLRESEQRYRALSEASFEGINILDKGEIIDTNRRLAEMLGYAPEELVGKKVWDLVVPEWRDLVRERIGSGFEDAYRVTVLKKDGSPLDVEVRGRMMDYDGKKVRVTAIQDITERLRAEKALRESEERYRLVVENVHEIIYMVSFGSDPSHGVFEFMSGHLEPLIGYVQEEFTTDPGLWSRLIHPDDSVKVSAATERMIQGRQPVVRKYRIRPKGQDGHRWFEDTITPRIEADAVTGYFGVARDITKRQKAEDLIRQYYETQSVVTELLRFSLSDVPLEDILNRALDHVLSRAWFTFDLRGCIFLADEQSGELVLTVQRNMDERERARCSRVSQGSCLCGRAAASKEIVYSRSTDDRHDFPYHGDKPHGHYCVPIVQQETLLGVINISLAEGYERKEEDIHFLQALSRTLGSVIQQKRMEEERARLHKELQEFFSIVARSQKEWQETFDTITDLISIHDQDHVIVRVNKAFARHFNRKPEELVGQKCFTLFHGTDRPIANCPHECALDRNRPVTEEVSDPKTGQVLLVSTFPYTFPGSEKRGTIHIARDITSEREKEMRLIMTERLASLGQMASGIAHEINNPLAAIAGCAEGLLNRVKQQRYDPEFFASYLAIIQEEIVRCKGITSSMLSIVRQTNYARREVDVNDTLNKSLEIIGFQGRLKTTDVIRDFDPELPVVYGSAGELKQVFLSIITNALDAIEDRGVLRIETRAMQDGVVIRIIDNGPGIAPEHLYKIFEPFFTTKADKGGTGLGLAIARKIVNAHQGILDVTSEPGLGTCFLISLPLADPSQPLSD